MRERNFGPTGRRRSHPTTGAPMRASTGWTRADGQPSEYSLTVHRSDGSVQTLEFSEEEWDELRGRMERVRHRVG